MEERQRAFEALSKRLFDRLKEIADTQVDERSGVFKPIDRALVGATYDFVLKIMLDSDGAVPLPTMNESYDGSVRMEWFTCDMDIEMRFLDTETVGVRWNDLASRRPRGVPNPSDPDAPLAPVKAASLTPQEEPFLTLAKRAKAKAQPIDCMSALNEAAMAGCLIGLGILIGIAATVTVLDLRR